MAYLCDSEELLEAW